MKIGQCIELRNTTYTYDEKDESSILSSKNLIKYPITKEKTIKRKILLIDTHTKSPRMKLLLYSSMKAKAPNICGRRISTAYIRFQL
jgi:hypothetical protein